MPACPYGAEPKPGFQGIVRWLQDADFPAEIVAILTTLRDLTDPYSTMQLWDIDEVCASNLDPPPAITTEDIVRWTALLPFGGAAHDTVFINKVIAWATYNVFLQNCQCKLPVPTPGFNCPPFVIPATVPGLGSTAPVPVQFDQAVMDAIDVLPATGEWSFWRTGSGHLVGGATGSEIVIEVRNFSGGWTPLDTIASVTSQAPFCNTRQLQNYSVGGFNAATEMRLTNTATGSRSVEALTYCLCAPAPVPPPLNVQPPLTNLPAPPPFECGTDTVCALIQDLLRRFSTLAGQVSDIQAALGGFDQLVELSRLTMTQEGEATLVLGTRAVSVELTALGDEAFTSALGRPRGLMRVGSVRWGDGIGYSPRRFIDADRFDDVRPAGATTLSWQLLPGTQGILKFLG